MCVLILIGNPTESFILVGWALVWTLARKFSSQKVWLQKKKKTQVIGLSGGQGSGKSTISNILKIILKENYNLETVIFSIDDFYKTLKEREVMSKNISPLFLTRGATGTHDTKMIYNCIKKFIVIIIKIYENIKK